MQYDWCVTDLANVAIGIVIVLNYGTGSARKFAWERLVEELDGHDYVLIAVLCVLVGDQL